MICVSQPLNGKVNIIPSTSISPAEELQQLLPYSKVVKTYNTALALDQDACKSNCNFTDAFIAGNNGVAVETVAELVKSAGLNPIAVGDLSASRTVEKIHFKMAGQPIKSKSTWREWWKGFVFLIGVLADVL